jgi:sec-independent protein translocase protein TatA
MITSLPDLLIIGGAALLIFGPKRLPELAKSLGVGLRDFKKAMNGEFEEDTSGKPEVLPPAAPSKQLPEQNA